MGLCFLDKEVVYSNVEVLKTGLCGDQFSFILGSNLKSVRIKVHDTSTHRVEMLLADCLMRDHLSS